jgi:hypothetical protein
MQVSSNMSHAELHSRIHDIAPAVLCGDQGDDVAELERGASIGCSVCARALVNARQVAVDLAMDAAGVPVPTRLRERVLASSSQYRGNAPPSQRVADQRPERAAVVRGPPDPASAVAHLHIGAPGDAERVRFIDATEASRERPGEQTSRILAQLERLSAFPLLFVSIVRGERVGYRVQRGLDGQLAEFRDMRREMTFCTHCVSADAPLLVPNAAREPFFRASKMVRRYGIGAYLGVPLRARPRSPEATGAAFGTLCALDFRRRALEPELVEMFEIFARLVVSEIQPRDVAEEPRERGFERLSNGSMILGEAVFDDVLRVQLARMRSGESAALLGIAGPAASCLATVARASEIVGRISTEAIGLMITNADMSDAARRAAEVRARHPGVEVRFACASAAHANHGEWQARALGR